LGFDSGQGSVAGYVCIVGTDKPFETKNIINQKNKTSMKNVLKKLALVAVMSAFLMACAEEEVRPRTGNSNDKCQFGSNCNN
jgi:hypothetical protein